MDLNKDSLAAYVVFEEVGDDYGVEFTIRAVYGNSGDAIRLVNDNPELFIEPWPVGGGEYMTIDGLTPFLVSLFPVLFGGNDDWDAHPFSASITWDRLHTGNNGVLSDRMFRRYVLALSAEEAIEMAKEMYRLVESPSLVVIQRENRNGG